LLNSFKTRQKKIDDEKDKDIDLRESGQDIPVLVIQGGRQRRRAIADETPKRGSIYGQKFIKDEQAKQSLSIALRTHELFSQLDDDDKKALFDVMQEKKYKANDVIITQGEQGDEFFVVENGTCDIFVQKENNPPFLVQTVNKGEGFGELALIYGNPRAATVIAKTEVTLWAIDRVSYRATLMDTTIKKRAMYEKFLEKVPLLAQCTKYELNTIADALETESYTQGTVIIKEGEPGDAFYIICEGEVRVTQKKNGLDVEVGHLQPSCYFGEIALLTDKPRAATVTALTTVKLAKLGVDRFVRVLGPCADILKRNMDAYKRYVIAQ